jgi:hypothetical protein
LTQVCGSSREPRCRFVGGVRGRDRGFVRTFGARPGTFCCLS